MWTFLPICATHLVKAGHLSWPQMLEKMTVNPAAVLGIDRGTLAALVWEFEPARRGRSAPVRLGDLAPQTPESLGLSKALRRYGFRFVGPTTAYAAMQSLGVVNDHLQGCHGRAACEAERRRLTVPGG